MTEPLCEVCGEYQGKPCQCVPFWKVDKWSYREAPAIQYMVTGCGISMLCNNKEAVIRAMKEFVTKGGTPTVKELEL